VSTGCWTTGVPEELEVLVLECVDVLEFLSTPTVSLVPFLAELEERRCHHGAELLEECRDEESFFSFSDDWPPELCFESPESLDSLESLLSFSATSQSSPSQGTEP
jgi:hypothetical protein